MKYVIVTWRPNIVSPAYYMQIRLKGEWLVCGSPQIINCISKTIKHYRKTCGLKHHKLYVRQWWWDEAAWGDYKSIAIYGSFIIFIQSAIIIAWLNAIHAHRVVLCFTPASCLEVVNELPKREPPPSHNATPKSHLSLFNEEGGYIITS